jgi:hypothetical protein
MLPHSGEKSLKYNTAIRAINRPIATDAYLTDTINVIDSEPTIPINDVCHVKYLNVGRKLGALAKSNARHDKLTPK